MTSQTALVVVDVQDGIANSTYGVPDAGEITHAISSIVPLARLHNETQSGSQGSKNSVEILLIQHDDKDPEDPLYRGKATWKLLFPPRQGVLGDMFSSNPDLAASLRGQDVKHLVFVGLQTDFCVRASILGAIASGFDPSDIILLQGAHSTYDNISTGESYQQIK
jgi:nicotinamidase-related amidase